MSRLDGTCGGNFSVENMEPHLGIVGSPSGGFPQTRQSFSMVGDEGHAKYTHVDADEYTKTLSDSFS